MKFMIAIIHSYCNALSTVVSTTTTAGATISIGIVSFSTS
jgi:hypothetical protein